MATMMALTFDQAREDWDGSTGMVPDRVPVPELGPGADQSHVIVRVKFAGFCGTDRGMWWRKSMGDMVLGSLRDEGATRRTFGHELLGEIVEVGANVSAKYGYKPGDIVSTESHVVCGTCYQCRLGEYHVCANEKIIGVSMDGCFAEYVKLPAKALWPTDLAKIRPEVAAIQEPFGNAVHACQVTDLRGKSVAILGTGTIGLFAVLIARGMGARKVIGIEPSAQNREQAVRLGCDHVIAPATPPKDRDWEADPSLREQVLEQTDGVGVDVAMEMAGFTSSVNNALRVTRRGGHVVLFGLKNGDARVQDFHKIIMNGLTMHGVVGRRLFQTWEITKGLLENPSNGIQDAIWNVVLNRGEDTVVDAATFDRASFEGVMARHTKPVLRFAG
jgi:threonine 3-dehydrogenase